MKVSLTLDTVTQLDNGTVSVAFQRHIKRAVEDCMDRPGDKSKRQVIMNCILEPVIADDGSCERVNFEIKLRSEVPPHRSRISSCEPRKGGLLLFNPETPENVNQLSLHEGTGE